MIDDENAQDQADEQSTDLASLASLSDMELLELGEVLVKQLADPKTAAEIQKPVRVNRSVHTLQQLNNVFGELVGRASARAWFETNPEQA